MATFTPTNKTCAICGYKLTEVRSTPHPEIIMGWIPTNRDLAWVEDFGRSYPTIHLCWPKAES